MCVSPVSMRHGFSSKRFKNQLSCLDISSAHHKGGEINQQCNCSKVIDNQVVKLYLNITPKKYYIRSFINPIQEPFLAGEIQFNQHFLIVEISIFDA